MIKTETAIENNKLVVNRVQDVTPILERANGMRNAGKKWDIGGQEGNWGRYVGSIPNVVVEMWLKENPNILQEPDEMYKKLQDPAFKKLWANDKI